MQTLSNSIWHTWLRSAAIVLLMSAMGCSTSDTENQALEDAPRAAEQEEETFPDFQEPDIIQSSISFFGWIGDSAVLAEEVFTENNESYAEYYILRPGEGEMEELEMDDSTVLAPGIVRSGTDVAPLHGMDPKEPFITLLLGYDSLELDGIERSLEQIDENSDLPDPVGGVVGIVWHRPQVGVDTLWSDSVYVGPYYGDTEVEYHLPEVTYSELSPSRRSLMVALWLNDYIEYFVFDLTRLDP